MEIYTGKKPYIFISYSQYDTKQVLPILKCMLNEEYRIWFEDKINIVVERKRSENIIQYLDKATCVIAFLTKNYLERDDCIEEIEYAKNKKIPIIIIYLEDLELPESFQMRFGRMKSINYHQYRMLNEFFEKLYKENILKYCKEEMEDDIDSKYFIGDCRLAKELKKLLLKFYENLTGFTGNIRNGDDELIGFDIQQMHTTIYKIHMFSEKYKCLDEKLANNATLIVQQFNTCEKFYIKFFDLEDRISEEAQNFAYQADMETKKLMEMIGWLLKCSQERIDSSDNYRTKKEYEKNNEKILKFKDLLLEYYEYITEFTEGLEFGDENLIFHSVKKIEKIQHKIYMFSEAYKFLDEKLSNDAVLVINQFDCIVDPYNQFFDFDSEGRMSEEAQKFAYQLETELNKLIDMLARLLKSCEERMFSSNRYNKLNNRIKEEKEFKNLLLGLYQKITEFTESLKFCDQKLLWNSLEEMERIIHRVHMLLRKYKFLNKKLSSDAQLIINQYNIFGKAYNQLVNSKNMILDERRYLGKKADIKLNELIDLIARLLY